MSNVHFGLQPQLPTMMDAETATAQQHSPQHGFTAGTMNSNVSNGMGSGTSTSSMSTIAPGMSISTGSGASHSRSRHSSSTVRRLQDGESSVRAAVIASASAALAEHAKGRPKQPFPLVLYDLLETMERHGLQSIVQWMPNGLSFRVHDIDMFVEVVMKNYFTSNKFKSFTRQLYLYGFKRLDNGSFFCPLFQRGNRDSCYQMRRILSSNKNKGGASVSAAAKGMMSKRAVSALAKPTVGPTLPKTSASFIASPSQKMQHPLFGSVAMAAGSVSSSAANSLANDSPAPVFGSAAATATAPAPIAFLDNSASAAMLSQQQQQQRQQQQQQQQQQQRQHSASIFNIMPPAFETSSGFNADNVVSKGDADNGTNNLQNMFDPQMFDSFFNASNNNNNNRSISNDGRVAAPPPPAAQSQQDDDIMGGVGFFDGPLDFGDLEQQFQALNPKPMAQIVKSAVASSPIQAASQTAPPPTNRKMAPLKLGGGSSNNSQVPAFVIEPDPIKETHTTLFEQQQQHQQQQRSDMDTFYNNRSYNNDVNFAGNCFVGFNSNSNSNIKDNNTAVPVFKPLQRIPSDGSINSGIFN